MTVPTRGEGRTEPVTGVCLISPYSPSQITGIGRFVESTARQFAALGIRSVVVHPAPGSPSTSFVDVSVTLGWRRLRDFELGLKTALELIRRRVEFSIIHAQQIHVQSALAALGAKVFGKPCVLTLHLRVPVAGGRLKRAIHRAVERLCFRYASAVVTVSEFAAETFGRPGIQVIENGVDTDVFSPSVSSREKIRRSLGVADDIVFVFAARWSRQKGLDVLLRAAGSDRLRGKPYRIVILGSRSTDEVRLLEENLPSGQHQNRVRVLGPVDNLADFLNACDVLVLPSRVEGLPMIFLEASAIGLPVLASDIPVHRLLVNRIGCGWTVPSGDAEALADMMTRIIQSGVPAVWRDRARRSVLVWFSLERSATRYLKLYRDLLTR